MVISELLTQTRAQMSVSIREAARALGCTEMTYRMWERGVWTPGAERARAIAAWTGLKTQDILAMLGVLDHAAPAPGRAGERAPTYGAVTDEQKAAALARLQSWFARIPSDVDLVAELIEDRRREALREDES